MQLNVPRSLRERLRLLVPRGDPRAIIDQAVEAYLLARAPAGAIRAAGGGKSNVKIQYFIPVAFIKRVQAVAAERGIAEESVVIAALRFWLPYLR